MPQLRFPEFSGIWREKNLGDLVVFFKGKGLPKADINPAGETECIRYGELYTYYSELIENIKSRTCVDVCELFLSEHGDVIIPASGESSVDIATASSVRKKGVALGGDINVLRSDMNGLFLAYYLNNARKNDIARYAQGISVIHLYAAQLKLLKIRIPDDEKESDKIADFLSSLDKKISLLKQKYSLLQQYKKGVMQQLFSQEIRFKDDNGKDFPDWQDVRLKDVLVLQSRAINMLDDVTYELITVKRRNEGIVSRRIFKGKDVLVKNQFQLREGQFVISKRQIVHGSCGIVPEFLEGAILSNEYNVFEANRKFLDIKYFNLFATTLEMRKAFFRNSDGVHIEKLLFKTQSWLKTKMQLPCVNEQLKILEFVKALEKKIELSAKQIELSQTFKKGLLQQMFV